MTLAEFFADANTAVKLVTSAVGAIVAAALLPGTPAKRFVTVLGGTTFAFFSMEAAAAWLKQPGLLGAIGFLIGFFSMALLLKVYDVVQLLDAKQISADAWAWVLRKWGA